MPWLTTIIPFKEQKKPHSIRYRCSIHKVVAEWKQEKKKGKNAFVSILLTKNCFTQCGKLIFGTLYQDLWLRKIDLNVNCYLLCEKTFYFQGICNMFKVTPSREQWTRLFSEHFSWKFIIPKIYFSILKWIKLESLGLKINWIEWKICYLLYWMEAMAGLSYNCWISSSDSIFLRVSFMSFQQSEDQQSPPVSNLNIQTKTKNNILSSALCYFRNPQFGHFLPFSLIDFFSSCNSASRIISINWIEKEIVNHWWNGQHSKTANTLRSSTHKNW